MSVKERDGSRQRSLSPQEGKQLQGSFVVGIILATVMFVQLMGRYGSMNAADLLRVVIGVTGLGASVASALQQMRRRWGL